MNEVERRRIALTQTADQGLLEIKCPLTATHLESLLGESRYAARARELMAVAVREDGAAAASRIIDDLVGGSLGKAA